VRRPALIALLVSAPLALAVAGCGDDGSAVRGATTAASAEAGGSGSGSGSGLAPDDSAEVTSSNPLIQKAVDDYEAYVRTRVGELRTRATALTDAVRAGDLAAARAAYAPSRVPLASRSRSTCARRAGASSSRCPACRRRGLPRRGHAGLSPAAAPPATPIGLTPALRVQMEGGGPTAGASEEPAT
jgi:Imelysin